MPIRELIEILEDYDEDSLVYIGTPQRYGSDFVYDISEICIGNKNSFYGEDEENVVFITTGRQCGVMEAEEIEEY